MNIKKSHNILNYSIAVFFVILSAVHIITASLAQRVLIYDGTIWFVNILNQISNHNIFPFYLSFDIRNRIFICIMNQMFAWLGGSIFNIQNKYVLGVLLSLPLFLLPFLVLSAQYFLAKRTKRYDILLLSLILYSVFILPCQMYSIVEASLALSLLFLLFHYLAAKINYTKWDIFFIVLLCIISYSSFEAVIYCGIIMFISSIYYSGNEQNIKNKAVKYFIGVNSLLASAFNVIYYRFVDGYYNVRLNEIFIQLLCIFQQEDKDISFADKADKYYYDHFFMILVPFIFSLIFIICYRKKLNLYLKFCFIFLYLLIAGFFAYNINIFMERTLYVAYRIFLFIIAPILILIPSLIDIFKASKFKMKIIINNLFLIVFLCGIINTAFQIYSTYNFAVITKQYITEMKKIGTAIITPDKMRKFYDANDKFFNCDTYMYDSIVFNPEYKINRIVIYDKENEYCPQRFYFNDKNNLFLNFGSIDIKTKFWDLTPIYQEVINNKDEKKLYYSETEKE